MVGQAVDELALLLRRVAAASRWSAAPRRPTATASGRAARRCAPSGPGGRVAPSPASRRTSRPRSRSRTVSIWSAASPRASVDVRSTPTGCASARRPRSAPAAGSASISANCSGPAISGGESWITGSPRSSARQISPRRYSSPDRKPRSSVSDSSSVNVLLGVLVLDQLDRVEVAGAAHVADDREVAQRVEHRAELALVRADVLEDALALDRVDVGQRDRRADRMAAEREAVREAVGARP